MIDEQPYIDVTVLEDRDHNARVLVHNRFAYSVEASFAFELVKAMSIGGMAPDSTPLNFEAGQRRITVSGSPNQEQRFYLMTPQALVDRAMEIAGLTLEAMRERGWAKPVPAFDDLRRESGGGGGFRADPGGS